MIEVNELEIGDVVEYRRGCKKTAESYWGARGVVVEIDNAYHYISLRLYVPERQEHSIYREYVGSVEDRDRFYKLDRPIQSSFNAYWYYGERNICEVQNERNTLPRVGPRRRSFERTV